MDLALTPDQELLQQTARDFATREVLPRAAENDRLHRFPADLVKRLGELGFLGVAIPEEHGGAGLDNVSYAIAIEEISRACASVGVIMSVNNSLACDPILKFGTEEQQRTWLAPMARGEFLGCYALSEPEAGSDAAAQKTVARAVDGGFTLTGTKNFITNGPNARVCVLFAMTAPELGHKGITAFLLPLDTRGVTLGPPDKKLGIRASQSCQIFLDDVRLPASAVLGEVGQGFKVAMHTLDGGRIGIAAQALGIAQRAFDLAVAHAKTRIAFGKPIGSNQAIQWMIADMAQRIEAARLLTWRAAVTKDGSDKARASHYCSMAKLAASETANFCADKALQIHGGYGFSKEYEVERLYRDARITTLYEGTSEIQRLVISRHYLA